MGQIYKEQTFDRSEDYGNTTITQKCSYNSVAEWLVIESAGMEISLSVDDFEMLIDLVNRCLDMKCGQLVEKLIK